MALADVYDALISRRIYKPAMSHEQAAADHRRGPRTHFDPDVVDAFLAIQDEFQAIARRFADAEAGAAHGSRAPTPAPVCRARPVRNQRCEALPLSRPIPPHELRFFSRHAAAHFQDRHVFKEDLTPGQALACPAGSIFSQ
jgi:hypothetical protein